ncbi:hypothetical protein [Arthrobacter sp. B10-11]|uniref:hypothetical protein n=1 Tax=Arthrobacter sp. B10-11 TaxID=3081160 RepID=UPI002952DF6D|nr:hypothetical protein [Arthrobacter sp. B10-11]MDV8147148.1 hypothetical protein [Arthrobacter sp. B10-11]
MAVHAPKRAAFLAAALLAAGVAGCEYANDVGPDPSRPSGTGTPAAADPFPLASVDPEFEAELQRNMAAVELILADVPAGAGGASGGISGHGAAGGGLTYNGVLTNAGTYTVTAACTGAVEAQLVVTSRGVAGSSEAIDVPCGEPVRRQLQLGTGPVTAYLVSPDESRVHKAAVGAVRIGSSP